MPRKQSSPNRASSPKQIRISKAGRQPQTATVPSQGAIFSPVFDFLCCGGLSIVVVIGIFTCAFLSPTSAFITQGVNIIGVAILGTLFNAPHFMASYPLLYRKRTQIAEHRWASTYIPLILLGMIVYAFLTPSQAGNRPPVNALVIDLLTTLGAILLAWHYTGQAWGMTGAFAYIRGIRMDGRERWLVRCGYYSLLVWHVLWACLFMLQNPEALIANKFTSQIPSVRFAYNLWSVVVLLTIPLGIIGFIRIRRRTGIMPSLRSYSPWIAIYLWYALIWAYPSMFPLLQIFHALQYLVFPLRVEINQYSARRQRSETKQILHGVAYYLFLVFVGLVVFELPTVPTLWGNARLNFLAVVSAFVNIHHYFIDGAIWKIRNPQVRRDLFAHLKLA